MSYEPELNDPVFYAGEDESCEVCTENPCLCERYKLLEEAGK